MDTNIPSDLINAVKSSQKERKNRLRVAADGVEYIILSLRDAGFTVDRDSTPHIRGCVDILDGARHLASCLVMRGAPDGDEVHYEFKRCTPVSKEMPLDYVVDPERPIAYLK